MRPRPASTLDLNRLKAIGLDDAQRIFNIAITHRGVVVSGPVESDGVITLTAELPDGTRLSVRYPTPFYWDEVDIKRCLEGLRVGNRIRIGGRIDDAAPGVFVAELITA